MKIIEVLQEMRDHRDAYQRDYDSSVSGMGRPHDHRGLSHELAHERNNLAIAINGKTWKVIPGRGYADSREEREYLRHMQDWAAKKSASSGKKWSVHITGAEPTNETLAETTPGYEGVAPEAKCSSCGTPYSKHFRFDANGNIQSTTIRGMCGRPENFKGISETATAGATSAASIGTVDAPHISPGKARGKKSYTGSPSTGSGTKAPPQPKVVQPKTKAGTAVNGLDIKGKSLFGGPANEGTVIKRR